MTEQLFSKAGLARIVGIDVRTLSKELERLEVRPAARLTKGRELYPVGVAEEVRAAREEKGE